MPYSIRLKPGIKARLDALAVRTGHSKAHHLRELVANGLDDLEAQCTAVEVSERIRRGEERTYTLDEVRRDLGWDD